MPYYIPPKDERKSIEREMFDVTVAARQQEAYDMGWKDCKEKFIKNNVINFLAWFTSKGNKYQEVLQNSFNMHGDYDSDERTSLFDAAYSKYLELFHND